MSQANEKAWAEPPDLALYRLRDELAEVHKPANAYERMLVTAIAQQWLRFQQAVKLENEFFRAQDARETITARIADLKVLTRFTAECERAWRHAIKNLESTQRRRLKGSLASPNARRAADRPLHPAARLVSAASAVGEAGAGQPQPDRRE